MLNFTPHHLGLYLNTQDFEHALAHQDDETIAPAWQQLRAPQPPFADAMSILIWLASRYRFLGDAPSGERAIHDMIAWGLPVNTSPDDLMTTLALMHAFEMLRDHPAWTGQQATWLTHLSATLDAIFNTQPTHALQAYWRITLRLAGAVVLEDEGAFQTGIAEFEEAINQHMHAEGYLRNIINLEQGASFPHHQSAIKALALSAEIARQAGHDLWQYDHRGVSLATGVAYQLYYYYFPDKWRWVSPSPYDEAFMHHAFTQGGAYIEIAAHRVRPRNVEFILEERRPFFDALGAGFTTLTHGAPPPKNDRKRRGWFA